jgi:hypothetical protein
LQGEKPAARPPITLSGFGMARRAKGRCSIISQAQHCECVMTAASKRKKCNKIAYYRVQTVAARQDSCAAVRHARKSSATLEHQKIWLPCGDFFAADRGVGAVRMPSGLCDKMSAPHGKMRSLTTAPSNV